MRSPAPLRRLERGPLRLWVLPEFEDRLAALELLSQPRLDAILSSEHAQRITGGRAPQHVLALAGERERLHLRPLRHGGWLASWRGETIADIERPLAELLLTEGLRADGAPVPVPVCVVAERRGRRWRAALGTLHEEGTVDGGRLLESTPGARRRRQAARAAGRAVRRFHDAGGCHADLHIGNLLFRECEARFEVTVIDLDGGRRMREVPARRRMRDLMRLYRSLLKHHPQAARDRALCAAFFGAYVAGDRPLRRALLAHLARERARVSLHAIGYRLTRSTG